MNASFKCDFSCGELSEFNVIIDVFPYICFAAISPLHQPAYPILDCDAEAQLKALNGFIMVIDPNSEVFYVSETVEQYLGFHQVSWFLYTFKFSTFHLYVEGILTEQYLCAMMIYLREILDRPNGWYPISNCLGCHRHSAWFTARKPSYTVVMRLDAILLPKKTFISGIVPSIWWVEFCLNLKASKEKQQKIIIVEYANILIADAPWQLTLENLQVHHETFTGHITEQVSQERPMCELQVPQGIWCVCNRNANVQVKYECQPSVLQAPGKGWLQTWESLLP